MKKEKPIVFQDVDDVSGKLSPVWLGKYNRDYNDSLTEKDITDWNIHNFVKPECGLHIYDYLKDPHIYDDVKPTPGALEGTRALREMGFRIIFATASSAEIAGRKFYWLKDWGFIEKDKDYRDYIEVKDKSLLRGDFMIDDSYDNVRTFVGYGFLMEAPWNIKYEWTYRADNWEDFINKMKEYKRKEI